MIENEYYITPDRGVIFHVKEINHQLSTATALVELDDWAGDKYFSGSYWHLKNGNMMVEMSDQLIRCLNGVTSIAFQTELIKQVNNSIDEIKKGSSLCRTNFKQTPKRMGMLRKYYGTKP